MPTIRTKAILLFSFLLLLPKAVFAESDAVLPEILDYYPDCDYQVLTTYTVKSKVKAEFRDGVKSFKLPKSKIKLLKRIRKEAQEIGADAVILLNKKIKNTRGSKLTNITKNGSDYTLSYEAELIKLCTKFSNSARRLTPLNHQGEKQISLSTQKSSRKEFVFTFPKKAKLKRPKLTNTEISLSNGLYGVKLGENLQHVIDTFGDPSVTLLLHEHELILSYGRRHWFYFQEDKLVKIQTIPPLLSQESINLIPILEFFDDYNWKVNKLIARHSNVAEVKLALGIDLKLNEKNQLIIQDNNNVLALDFSVSVSYPSKEKNYALSGFTLQTNSYQSYLTNNIEQRDQNLIIEQAYLKLQESGIINTKELNKQLGEPLGYITLSMNSELNIYNSNLIVQTRGSELESIYFNEEVFLEDHNFFDDLGLWQLGPFIRGRSLEEITTYLPDDAYITDDEVEIETESYTLSLFFGDIDGENSLYQAELKFH
jgi:hypothetical protein